MAVMVFGGWHLQRLTEVNKIHWDTTSLKELAFAYDATNFYWIAATDTNKYLSIMCRKDFTHPSWGLIRKNKDGYNVISHRIPKEIEKALRKHTAERLSKKQLPSMLAEY